jgi:hypothetical protein
VIVGISDLKTIADKVGLSYRQPGASHVTFGAKAGRMLTVPAKKPIKPIYIKLFVELVDEITGGES